MTNLLFIEHIAGIGGGQVCLLELLRHLDRDKFEPTVTLVAHGELYDRVAATGARTEIVDIRGVKGKHPGMTLGNLVDLARIVKRQNIDLIHVNSQKALLFALPVGVLTRTPVIWHCHVDRDFGRFYDLIGSLFSRAIVVNSQYVNRRFDHMPFARNKIRLIYNGIDIDRIRSADGGVLRRALGIDEGAMVVGTFGRLQEEKGMQYFIEAAIIVGKEIPEAVFVLVGGSLDPHDPYEEQLRAAAQASGLARRTIFTGFRSDIPDCIAAMDIVVIPSLREGLPLAVAEAMAVGKPIVATAVGGIPEMIENGQTGILVEPRQPEAIAREVVALARDRARAAALGQAARLVAESKFSITTHAAKMQQLYSELAS